MESGEFGEIYSKLAEQGKKAEGLLEAPLAYDAVWAIALGSHNTSSPPNLLPSPQRLSGQTGGQGPVPRRLQLRQQARARDHQGPDGERQVQRDLGECVHPVTWWLQGSVAFSEETGDRMAWTQIEQLIDQE